MSDNLPSNERPKTPETTPSSGLSNMPGTMWGGVALIGIGAILLLQSMGILSGSFNWWAIFILIPAVNLLYRAYQRSQETGQLDHHVRGPLIGGAVLTMIAVTFLFDMSWSLMGPVFLIMIGVALFLTARR